MMGKGNFTDEFKLEAIKQITERGYSVADVSKRLGVSTHSLYGWMKRYSVSPGPVAKDDQSSEIRRLKQELARVTEERDILKKATAYFAKDAK
jgi:transposase